MESDIDGLSADAIRSEVQRILDSPDFDASKRNRDFLNYIVDESLHGRSERIKAYSIATLVFGRDEDFDPQADPVVRFEARRLRRSLERYYLMSGKDDPIRVTVPKGSYIPSFEKAAHDRSEPGDPQSVESDPGKQSTARGRHPAVLVLPFDVEGDHPNAPSLARGFVRHLIAALTRFRELFVYGWETSLQISPEVDLRALREKLDVDYVLTGGVVVTSDRFSVEVVLINSQTGFNAWSAMLERTLTPSEIIEIRDEFAESVARTLGQPYGIIQSSKAKEIDGLPPIALSSYACVVRYYQYARNYNREEYEQVRDCLEKTIEEEPSYAEAFACLSQLYSDGYRFRFADSVGQIDARRRALDLARRAVQLAPDSSQCFLALARAYWFNDDVEASLAALETGQSLNPNDSLLMAEAGLRHAVLGNWEKAEALLTEAYARNPAQPGGFRVGLALYHYAHGEFQKALFEARKVDAPHVPYGHVLEAISLAALDRNKEAARIVNVLLAHDPEFGSHLHADLKRRHVDDSVIDMVAAGLRSAGLPGIEGPIAGRV